MMCWCAKVAKEMHMSYELMEYDGIENLKISEEPESGAIKANGG